MRNMVAIIGNDPLRSTSMLVNKANAVKVLD